MPFVSFSCLVALARTSSIMLNKSDENEHSFHVPDLEEKLFITEYNIKYNVSCGLVIYHIWPLLC